MLRQLKSLFDPDASLLDAGIFRAALTRTCLSILSGTCLTVLPGVILRCPPR